MPRLAGSLNAVRLSVRAAQRTRPEHGGAGGGDSHGLENTLLRESQHVTSGLNSSVIPNRADLVPGRKPTHSHRLIVTWKMPGEGQARAGWWCPGQQRF